MYFCKAWKSCHSQYFFIFNEMVIISFLCLCIPSLLKSGVGIRYLIYILKKYKCITTFLKRHLFQEWHAYTSLSKKSIKDLLYSIACILSWININCFVFFTECWVCFWLFISQFCYIMTILFIFIRNNDVEWNEIQ